MDRAPAASRLPNRGIRTCISDGTSVGIQVQILTWGPTPSRRYSVALSVLLSCGQVIRYTSPLPANSTGWPGDARFALTSADTRYKGRWGCLARLSCSKPISRASPSLASCNDAVVGCRYKSVSIRDLTRNRLTVRAQVILEPVHEKNQYQDPHDEVEQQLTEIQLFQPPEEVIQALHHDLHITFGI